MNLRLLLKEDRFSKLVLINRPESDNRRQRSHRNGIRKRAEQGLAEAQFLLGACYYDGKGTAKDLNKAFFWYRKAAYQNLAEAQYFLGMCYYSGEGVEQDNNQSAHWLNKALENGLDGERATLARDMVRRIERPSSTLR